MKINRPILQTFLIVLIFTSFYSCKKNDSQVNSASVSKYSQLPADVSKAAQWYDQQLIDRNSRNVTGKNTIDWSKVIKSTMPDGSTVYALQISGAKNVTNELNISQSVDDQFYAVVKSYSLDSQTGITTLKFLDLDENIIEQGVLKENGKYTSKNQHIVSFSPPLKEQPVDLPSNNGGGDNTGGSGISIGVDGSGQTIVVITAPSTPSDPGPVFSFPSIPSFPSDPGLPGGGGSNGGTASSEELFMSKIDNSRLSPCFKSVLTSLQAVNNNCIANTLEVFSGDIPGYNWKMQDGSAGGNNGVTSSAYDRINGSVTTTFNSSNYTGGSDLAIAKTILHESVHAYLVAHFNIDQSTASTDYAQYVEDYYSTKRPDMNMAQHNELVRSFVGSIADQLKQFGISKGYNLTDQFYNDLSWGGLTDTNAFKSFSTDAQDRIKNVILSEQSGANTNGNPSPPKGKLAGC